MRFTPTGRTQFLSAIAYIRRDKISAAQHFRKQAEKALRRLERFPNSGRVIPEFPELSQREVVVPPYRFFYRTIGDTVWIVGVWHGAQLPDQPLD
ncbi:MAG: type II toxin-antitoxin system RelE/ParE family toxin [FCB group bacterium]|nr:type II toxin-antitoxin system RelE/ParE family toxin [FCB group bacterium]